MRQCLPFLSFINAAKSASTVYIELVAVFVPPDRLSRIRFTIYRDRSNKEEHTRSRRGSNVWLGRIVPAYFSCHLQSYQTRFYRRKDILSSDLARPEIQLYGQYIRDVRGVPWLRRCLSTIGMLIGELPVASPFKKVTTLLRCSKGTALRRFRNRSR